MPKIVDDAWNFVKNNVQRLRSKKSLEPEPEPEPNQEEPHNFEIHETEVALDGTARRYSIGGREEYDLRMFLNAVETQVTNLLARSRQSRVYLVLSCDMGEA